MKRADARLWRFLNGFKVVFAHLAECDDFKTSAPFLKLEQKTEIGFAKLPRQTRFRVSVAVRQAGRPFKSSHLFQSAQNHLNH